MLLEVLAMADRLQTIQVQDAECGAVYQLVLDWTTDTVVSITQIDTFTKNASTKLNGVLGVKVSTISTSGP